MVHRESEKDIKHMICVDILASLVPSLSNQSFNVDSILQPAMGCSDLDFPSLMLSNTVIPRCVRMQNLLNF